jgi:uncharacterized protein (DUF736 family)
MKKENVMATIGTFIAVENGYEGTLETLTIKAQVVLEKRQKTKDKQPDYDMFADGREIGAAWERMGFLSLNIDDPSFPPGNCTLKKTGAENRYTLTFQHRREAKSKD